MSQTNGMMNQASGWMNGGMWIWTVIGILLVVLVAVAILRQRKK